MWSGYQPDRNKLDEILTLNVWYSFFLGSSLINAIKIVLFDLEITEILLFRTKILETIRHIFHSILLSDSKKKKCVRTNLMSSFKKNDCPMMHIVVSQQTIIGERWKMKNEKEKYWHSVKNFNFYFPFWHKNETTKKKMCVRCAISE